MFLWRGVPGSIFEKINFDIVLSAAHVNLCSWYYKFYDVKGKKIRDCKIYSSYEHFKNRGFMFKSLAFTNGATYHAGLNEYLDQIREISYISVICLIPILLIEIEIYSLYLTLKMMN